MKNETKVYVGMDVHKDTVMIAVLPEGEREPTLVKRLSHDPRGIRRLLDRLARKDEVRACYEASGAGYVLERMIRGWGHACEIVAPSLIPRRPGERRKHDRKDAEELARLYRAGELVTIRVPTEREERVRDVVRCREAFQREALKSRHYILKFLARRGLVYREGQNWTGKHMTWLRAIQRDAVLEPEDQIVFGEYLALLDYKLDRREELDRQIEALALEPAYREAVGRLCCLKGISTQAAMVLVTEIGDFRRFEHPGKLMAYVGLVPSEHSSGGKPAAGIDHEGGQQPGSPCTGAGSLELPLSASAGGGAEASAAGPAARRHRAQLEGAAPAPQGVRPAGVPEEQPDRGRGGGKGAGRVRVGAYAGH